MTASDDAAPFRRPPISDEDGLVSVMETFRQGWIVTGRGRDTGEQAPGRLRHARGEIAAQGGAGE